MDTNSTSAVARRATAPTMAGAGYRPSVTTQRLIDLHVACGKAAADEYEALSSELDSVGSAALASPAASLDGIVARAVLTAAYGDLWQRSSAPDARLCDMGMYSELTCAVLEVAGLAHLVPAQAFVSDTDLA